MTLKSVAVVVALPLLVACGKSSSSSTPLTSDQKTSLKETTDSAARATNSARSAGGHDVNHSNAVSESLQRFSAIQSANPPASTAPQASDCKANPNGTLTCSQEICTTTNGSISCVTNTTTTNGGTSMPASDPAQTSMSQTLMDSQNAGKCDIAVKDDGKHSVRDLNASAMEQQPGNNNFSIQVSGQGCPVELSLSGSTQSTSNSVNIDLSIAYNVKDDSFRKLNDVDRMNMNGSMKAAFSNGGGALNVGMNGSIHSIQRGDVSIQISGDAKTDQNSGSGEIKAVYGFRDFTAELKYTVDGKTEKYTLNGETISSDEFYSYLNKTMASK